MFHREVSRVIFQVIVIVAFAGENPFLFQRKNLLKINLVTLTDEGFTSRFFYREQGYGSGSEGSEQ